MNSIPECFANLKILALRRDVISVCKSPWREFLIAAFRTITNSVATVLRHVPLTCVHYVSIDYFSESLVGILRWPTTLHDKSKSLTVIRSLQKQIHSRQNQINSMLYFYPAKYIKLVSSVYILLAILQFAEEFLVLASLH